MTKAKRLFVVMLATLALMLVATVALAQEAETAEEVTAEVGDAIGAAAVLAAIHLLSQPLVKIVDRVKNWFSLGGWQITLTAVILGTGLAWTLNLDPFPALNTLVPEGLSLRDFPSAVGYLVGGAWMAFRAGYLNDNTEALEHKVVIETDESGNPR